MKTESSKCKSLLLQVRFLPASTLTSSSKTFVISHHPNPIFDLLDHLLFMTIYDDIFMINFKDFERIY